MILRKYAKNDIVLPSPKNDILDGCRYAFIGIYGIVLIWRTFYNYKKMYENFFFNIPLLVISKISPTSVYWKIFITMMYIFQYTLVGEIFTNDQQRYIEKKFQKIFYGPKIFSRLRRFHRYLWRHIYTHPKWHFFEKELFHFW